MPSEREIDLAGLGARIEALPGFARLRNAVEQTGIEARVIGGAVREGLLGHDAPLDVVTEGDQLALAAALGGELRPHERFQTAIAATPDGLIDVVRARTETYPHPGALPEVTPADFDADLARRDFTINTIAVAVGNPGTPIDPLDGLGDLRRGILRSLHERSFTDDPTRALRAARYAARLGLEVEEGTLAGLRAADLSTVSADRVDAELRRIAAEPAPRPAFELLDTWGLMSLAEGTGELVEALGELLAGEPWTEIAAREDAILGAVRGDLGEAAALARLSPGPPSEIVEAARGHSGRDLALARVLGAAWLDDYAEGLRGVRLEISGEDLLAAGVEQGPAVGRGLDAALRARLDGEAGGREEQLRVAIAAAQAGG
jgi:tRNA nucleotidyltransferase (CCA-adding enzyme)